MFRPNYDLNDNGNDVSRQVHIFPVVKKGSLSVKRLCIFVNIKTSRSEAVIISPFFHPSP
jgi:hypothetical protein